MEFNIKNNVLISITGDDEEIIIPDGVKLISEHVFDEKENVTSISLPRDLKGIERNTFLPLINLKRIFYRGSLKDWFNVKMHNKYSSPFCNLNKGSTFYYLDDHFEFIELVDLNMPLGIKNIGSYQFYGFSMIKTLTMNPDDVVVIGNESFSSCVNLRKVDLGRRVNEIDDFAFRNCQFKKITIPMSVKIIGAGIFYGNKDLQTIYFKNDMLPINTDNGWLLGTEAKVEFID